MIGDSAGAHLSALVALAGDETPFSGQYRNDSYAATRANIKAVIGFYGVYDMVAQWEHDQITRPRDSVTEKLLGCPPMVSRKTFFEASPLSYATVDKNSTRFLLIYGREDDMVDPVTQSEKFLTALKQAGFFARTIVVPGAGHFWSVDPVEEPGSFGAYAGPRVLRFLAGAFPEAVADIEENGFRDRHSDLERLLEAGAAGRGAGLRACLVFRHKDDHRRLLCRDGGGGA